MMTEKEEQRFQEIMKIAIHLGWVGKAPKGCSYPIIQWSELEKCMVAMVDDFELDRMREWYISMPAKKMWEIAEVEKL